LIHRDLKPNNLMLTRTGDIKISDFGASQIVDSEATQLSGVVGSPSYMSPEQISEKELDYRSDMFSLGVVLYELLVGRRPFEADNMMTLMYQITQIPHRPLLARRARLPAALDQVIDTALQKNPKDRFPTWQAFADSLAAIDSALVVTKDEAPDREMFMALRKNPFFESFNDAQIWQTLRVARWHKLRAGAVLIDEGQAGNSFSILIEGEANVSRNGAHLASIKPGASMGEMAFLTPDDPQRSATITAATQVLVLKMTRATLEEAGVDLRAQFERRFLQILVDRLRAANP
jgi:serine/threonine protein kinase